MLPPRTWTGPICAITPTTRVRHLDDPAQVTGYQDQGVTVIEGRAAFTGPRTVTVANCEVSADNILIATRRRTNHPAHRGTGRRASVDQPRGDEP